MDPVSWLHIIWLIDAAAAAKSLQSCPTLCDPIGSSPPGSPVPGILQARTLEWLAISFSNAWKWKVESESEIAQSCPTLSNPVDCGPPGSSVHGIFQARVLEWGAIAFSWLMLVVNKSIFPLYFILFITQLQFSLLTPSCVSSTNFQIPSWYFPRWSYLSHRYFICN